MRKSVQNVLDECVTEKKRRTFFLPVGTTNKAQILNQLKVGDRIIITQVKPPEPPKLKKPEASSVLNPTQMKIRDAIRELLKTKSIKTEGP